MQVNSIRTNYPSGSVKNNGYIYTTISYIVFNTFLDLKYKKGNKNSCFDFSHPISIKSQINVHLIYLILGICLL